MKSQGQRVGAAGKRRTWADKSSWDDSKDGLWAGGKNEKGDAPGEDLFHRMEGDTAKLPLSKM